MGFEKKNILVLTSVYPQLDDGENKGVTPVVHYFAKEWVKQGHNVLVIHIANKYPKIFYWLPKKYITIINSKIGMICPKSEQKRDIKDVRDGVVIYRSNILKIIPHGSFFSFQILNKYKVINEILNKETFNPQIAIGHWENPQLEILIKLKKEKDLKTAVVFHSFGKRQQKYIDKIDKKNLEYIDKIGGRSQEIVSKIDEYTNLSEKLFICKSGVSREFIDNIDKLSNIKKVYNSYIFVGRLIERKNVDSIIKALSKAHIDKNFTLEIVGDGIQRNKLIELANNLNIADNIKYFSDLTRKEVMNKMNENQIFTMISKNEAFGLVYLEAMACGCIVIGSKNEGIDGIIIDGYNGFLCEAGNEEELSKIYIKIAMMEEVRLLQIKINAINTVKKLDDSIVANEYLNKII